MMLYSASFAASYFLYALQLLGLRSEQSNEVHIRSDLGLAGEPERRNIIASHSKRWDYINSS